VGRRVGCEGVRMGGGGRIVGVEDVWEGVECRARGCKGEGGEGEV